MMTTHSIRRVLLLADSSLLADELLDPARFDSMALAQGAEVVAGGRGSFNVCVSFDFGDVELQWVAARGCLISSLWRDDPFVRGRPAPAAERRSLGSAIPSKRRNRGNRPDDHAAE